MSLQDRIDDLLDRISEADDWLDSGVGPEYVAQPLAQHWARVSKVVEEAGESIAELILWTAQNPRKPQDPEAYHRMLSELADTAITAVLAIQHFTKSSELTASLVDDRFELLVARMREPEAAEYRLTALGSIIAPDGRTVGDVHDPARKTDEWFRGMP